MKQEIYYEPKDGLNHICLFEGNKVFKERPLTRDEQQDYNDGASPDFFNFY